MNKVDCIQHNICRCCLKPDIENTFQSLTRRLLDMFEACTTFKVMYDIGPLRICPSCFKQLSQSYAFHDRCKTSNEILKNKVARNGDNEKEGASTESNVNYEKTKNQEQSYHNIGISPVKNIYRRLVKLLEKKNLYCSPCRRILKKISAVCKHFERHECRCYWRSFSGSEVRYNIDLKSGISTLRNEKSYLQIFPEGNNQCEVLYSTLKQIVKSEPDVNIHDVTSDVSDHHQANGNVKSEVEDVFNFQYKYEATLGCDQNKDGTIKVNLKTECELPDLSSELQRYEGSDTEGDSEDDKPLKIMNRESFNCRNCNKHFEDINKFQEHMHTHQWPMEQKCDICGKEFKTLRGLRLHKIIHADVKKFVCDICGKGFVFEYKLKQHSRTHTNEKIYTCEQCGKMYKTMRILKIHYLTHAAEKLFSCQNCGKRFRTQHNLKAHVKRCGGNKDYICNECGKAFVNKTELLIHMRAHTKEKPYPCAHCDKSFKTQSHRAVHVRSHTGERPHKCTDCGKCFMIKRTLKIHMRIHSGELPYHCTVCNRRFRQPNVLKTHMKVHKILTFGKPSASGDISTNLKLQLC